MNSTSLYILTGAGIGLLLAALGAIGACIVMVLVARMLRDAGRCPYCWGDPDDPDHGQGEDPQPDLDPAAARPVPTPAQPATVPPAADSSIDVDPMTERQARHQIARALAAEGPDMQERVASHRDPVPGHRPDCGCVRCWERMINCWLAAEIRDLTADGQATS